MGVYIARIFLPGQPLTYTRIKTVLCQTHIIGSMISQDIMDVMFDISNPPKKKKNEIFTAILPSRVKESITSFDVIEPIMRVWQSTVFLLV